MNNPIPVTPEDPLFPSEFKELNEFVRSVAVGGEVEMRRGTTRDEDGTITPFIDIQHRDRGAKFRIVKFSEMEFLVVRLPDGNSVDLF